jgi:hypothetical protein
MDWPSPTTMSAPMAPGGVDQPSDTASVKTAMSSAPFAWRRRRWREVAQVAEHVRRLHDDAGGLVVDARDDVLEVGAATSGFASA